MSPQVDIRFLREEDVAATAAACFPESPADEVEARLREEIDTQQQGRGFTLAAESGGRIGAAITVEINGVVGWIHNVAAHPDFRGSGVIQRMFTRVVTLCRERGLERLALHVRSTNTRAITAYERAGFRFAAVDGMRGEQLRYQRPLAGGRAV